MNNNRFLTFKQVRDRTGLSRSTIWRLERAGKFPSHHRISPNRVAWDENAITNWIEQTIRQINSSADHVSEEGKPNEE